MRLLYKALGISKKDLFNSSNWCEKCTRSFHYGRAFYKVEGCCFENSSLAKHRNNVYKTIEAIEKVVS